MVIPEEEESHNYDNQVQKPFWAQLGDVVGFKLWGMGFFGRDGFHAELRLKSFCSVLVKCGRGHI